MVAEHSCANKCLHHSRKGRVPIISDTHFQSKAYFKRDEENAPDNLKTVLLIRR